MDEASVDFYLYWILTEKGAVQQKNTIKVKIIFMITLTISRLKSTKIFDTK
jgi:hypothetical protein